MKESIIALLIFGVILLATSCSLDNEMDIQSGDIFVEKTYGNEQIIGPGTDMDSDGIPDILEMDLAKKYFPQLNIFWGKYGGLEHGDRRQLYGHSVPGYPDSSAGTLPIYARKYKERCIEIRYGLAWNWDMGDDMDPFGLTCHRGDSELYAVILCPFQPNGEVVLWEEAIQGTACWNLVEDFCAAHWGAIGDSSSRRGFGYNGTKKYQTLWSAEGKHGTYSSKCACDNGGFEDMDYCGDNQPVKRAELVSKLQNTGEPKCPIDPIILYPGETPSMPPYGQYNVWSDKPFGSDHATSYYKQFTNRIGWTFTPNTTTPTPGIYSLSVQYRDSDGAVQNETYPGLTWSSRVSIQTTPYFVEGDPSHQTVKIVFVSWLFSKGDAVIEDPGLNSTSITEFASDTVIYAQYLPENITPSPTDTPSFSPTPKNTPTDTPKPPPTFVITVQYRDENGVLQSESHPGLVTSSSVHINTTQYFYEGDPSHQTVKLVFNGWFVTGGATVANPQFISTEVSNFTSNATVTALYLPEGMSPPATVTPTTTPEITPTDTPTSTPTFTPTQTPTPQPRYTLFVQYVDANGTLQTSTHADLLGSSVVGITTAPYYYVGDPSHQTVKLVFCGWLLTGGATVANPQSVSTDVSNYTSNATVTAQYLQETITLPPTSTPQNTPTPTNSPSPTHTKPPTFTCIVYRVDPSGTWRTDSYPGLSYSSSINISTASSFQAGPAVMMQFSRWQGSSGVKIDNTLSTFTTVRNFTGNCSVAAIYY
ncbi:MAG: hypothetical protein JW969_05590 [Spirochaetales bacterium]|nr:hypothetical protein [Spirochaetales bacterium]